MNAFWGNLAGVVTVILMSCFIGIWIWAWRPRHRRIFEAMARVPLEDTPLPDGLSGDAGSDAADDPMSEPHGDGRLHEGAK